MFESCFTVPKPSPTETNGFPADAQSLGSFVVDDTVRARPTDP